MYPKPYSIYLRGTIIPRLEYLIGGTDLAQNCFKATKQTGSASRLETKLATLD